MRKLLAMALCGLALSACAVANNGYSTPALWKVSDADNSVYLLGSFHALQKSDYPLSPAVNAAYEDAEVLMFEISPEEMLSPELGLSMQNAARIANGKTLADIIPQAQWRQVQAWLKANPGIPEALIRQSKPWFAALVISQIEMQKLGFTGEQGLDRYFMAEAGKSGKPTRGLEAAAAQVRLFDGMSDEVQRQFLAESLKPVTDMTSELTAMHTAWRKGDAVALEKITVKQMRQEYPSLYRTINVDRNNAWIPQIRQFLDQERNDDALVVVGTLHLLGSDGLVQGLKAQGLRVQRIQ